MQHTRLVSRQAENAVLSTVAYAGYHYGRNKRFRYTIIYLDGGIHFYSDGGAAGSVSLYSSD